jgi:hypothetical protein
MNTICLTPSDPRREVSSVCKERRNNTRSSLPPPRDDTTMTPSAQHRLSLHLEFPLHADGPCVSRARWQSTRPNLEPARTIHIEIVNFSFLVMFVVLLALLAAWMAMVVHGQSVCEIW